jgi:hypothetical protein
MKNRDEFVWRPNDNSATTLTKYSLEAAHWSKAFKSNEIRQNTTSFSDALGVIGLILGIIVNLITLTITIIYDIIKWYRRNQLLRETEIQDAKARLIYEENYKEKLRVQAAVLYRERLRNQKLNKL